MKNILFYTYVEIADVHQFQKEQMKLCKRLGLKGKVLIAEEGINGCLSGKEARIEEYKAVLTQDERFKDVQFKEALVKEHTFKKMFVRIRKEIVTSHFPVDIKDKADYIEPEDLRKKLDAGEEVVLVDVRNVYENTLGKFKDAVIPKTITFRQFPKAVAKTFSEEDKEKEIVTYCTGGVRCEKASAYLKAQGFTKVKQLHGGIIRYGQECGNAHWEGKCFVFDQRGAIDIDPDKHSEDITQCELCKLPCSTYHNCVVVECDRRFISCDACLEVLEGCCSKKCRGDKRASKKKCVAC